MISHLADPARPLVALCGACISPDPAPGRREVCMSCMPSTHRMRIPVRLARPYCEVCGQPEGHWDGCPTMEGTR